MSDEAPTGSVLGEVIRSPADSISWSRFVPLSTRAQRDDPSVSNVRASCLRPVSSFDPEAPPCCMLGERSSSTTVVSGLPPAASPTHPPARGRLMAKTSAPIAAILIAMMSHWRMRAYPRAIRFAASRNIIAAQRIVW